MAGGWRTAAAMGLAAALAAGPPASASPATGGPVRIGRAPRLPVGSELLGRIPAATRIRLTLALRPRNAAGLAAYAAAVSSPGSALYRRYLSRDEFARRFGASPATLRSVARSLRRHGLHPGRPAANRLAISVSAPAGALERAFRVALRRLRERGGSAVVATGRPALDPGIAGRVRAVIGLSSASSPRPLLLRARRHGALARTVRPHVATDGPQPCAAARSAAPGQSALTADQIASAYGMPGLYEAGDRGAGVTVAVYELEPFTPADIASYQACYGTSAIVTRVAVDGGAGGQQTGEAALDIENVIGTAPAAHVLVYEGPDVSTGPGPFDTYQAIVSQDRAQVATTSWGDCEPAIGQATAQAENALFQEAAVQGQTILSAGGDDGSEDCNGDNGLVDTSLNVEDPASQPFVTGVGGTELLSLGPRPSESVWNNGGSLADALTQPGAGGGGVSSFWAMPAFQRQTPAFLRVTSSASTGAPCGASGPCRQVPDVSADADPSTGYLVFWNGSGTFAGQPSGWQGVGGTSAAAPVWAGVLALADASPGCAGSPIGYANPALYRAAAGAYGSGYNDVSSGNNDFTGTAGGRYAAGPGYDMASGLGTPNASSLSASLCRVTMRLANPGDQSSTVRTSVALRLRASDGPGFAPAYRATGLPPGLRLSSRTGRITGRPRRTGTFTVKASAADRQGSRGRVVFRWRIGGPPRVTAVTFAGGSSRPRLTFNITSASGSPPIAGVSAKVSRSLAFASTRAITVRGSGLGRLPHSTRLRRGTLTLSLRRTSKRVRIQLGPSSLRVRGGATLRLALTVTDAHGGRTQLTVTARRRG